MSKKIKDFRGRQQVKEEQINFLLSGVDKNLEEYKIAIEISFISMAISYSSKFFSKI